MFRSHHPYRTVTDTNSFNFPMLPGDLQLIPCISFWHHAVAFLSSHSSSFLFTSLSQPRYQPTKPRWKCIRTCHVASDGRPNGGAGGHADLTITGNKSVLLEQVVSMTVVVTSTDASQSRHGGNESSLHDEKKEAKLLFVLNCNTKKNAR